MLTNLALLAFVDKVLITVVLAVKTRTSVRVTIDKIL